MHHYSKILFSTAKEAHRQWMPAPAWSLSIVAHDFFIYNLPVSLARNVCASRQLTLTPTLPRPPTLNLAHQHIAKSLSNTTR